jgi:DNA primase
MDDKLIEQINEKTPIVDLVSEFVSLAKRGKNYMGLCPFHQEKTPSFSVSPEKNIAKCMSCGEGGSPINFYRKIKNISFEEAAQDLAIRAGIEIKTQKIEKDPNKHFYQLMNEVASFYQFNLKNSEKGQEAIQYLYNRQMTDALIQHFRLGYAPMHGQTLYNVLKDKGYAVSDMILLGVVKQSDDGSYYDLFSDRVIFPITNPKGEVVGLSGRTMNPKEQVKYINSPETTIFKKGQLLYHFYEALSEIRMSKQVVLYEGFFDVISSYAAGVKNGVATMGTALTKEQTKLIKSVTQSLIVAYDGDSAGMKASDHAIPMLEREGLKVEVLMIPEKMDPDDFVKAYGPEQFEMLFGEYTKDAYQFRYDYYKMGLNLANANDMKSFRQKVLDMIRNSDASIKAFYTQKLSLDLGIPLSEFDFKKETARKEPVIPKIEKPRMLNKYEKAERCLIFEMMKSKAICGKVMKVLKPTDFADHITASIRIDIERYYYDHQTFDLNDFLDSLNAEHRQYVEGVLLKDTYWVKQLTLDDSDIHDYVELVKLANVKRRYDEIQTHITQIQIVSQTLIEERDRLMGILKEKP